MWIGLQIPTKCPFRAAFKLDWTPCALNPFYAHMVRYSVWARVEQDKLLGWDNDD